MNEIVVSPQAVEAFSNKVNGLFDYSRVAEKVDADELQVNTPDTGQPSCKVQILAP